MRNPPLFQSVLLSLTIITGIWVASQVAAALPDDDLREDNPLQCNNQDFSESGILEETAALSESDSACWWLSSGAYFITDGGVGRTVHGELPVDSPWYERFRRSSPGASDNGFHPQNIFRLVAKGSWQNLRQEVYFRIVRDNLSESPDRNQSNGLLLMQRYLDSDNLYYTGIRVDGAAVIKKKINGTYYQVAYQKIFEGEYDRADSPNLLPKQTWIGVRSEVETKEDGTVEIRLFIDRNNTSIWELVLVGIDDGTSFGGEPLTQSGHAGIRTDFMDVEFDNYKVTSPGDKLQ